MTFEIGDTFSFETPDNNGKMRNRDWMMIVKESKEGYHVKFFAVKKGLLRPDSDEEWDIVYDKKDLLEMRENKGIRRVSAERVAKAMLHGYVERF